MAVTLCDKAMEVLRFNVASAKGETVKVGAEVQITFDAMLEPREHMHHAYNFIRAENQEVVLVNFAANNNALRAHEDDDMFNACHVGDLASVKRFHDARTQYIDTEFLCLAVENNHPDLFRELFDLCDECRRPQQTTRQRPGYSVAHCG